MKKLNLFLTACIALLALGAATPVSAEETPSAVVLEYSQYRGTANMDISSAGRGNGDESCNNPDKATYFKFDLQPYIDLNYNIVGATLVMNSRAPYMADGSVFINAYDCVLNDLLQEQPEAKIPCVSMCYVKPSPLSPEDYPALTGAEAYGETIADASVFDSTFNLTKYVKGKLDAGINSFTLELYPAFGGSIYYLESKPVLYLNIDGTNYAPQVEITSPSEEQNIYEGVAFDFSITAEDDRGIESIELYYDDEKLENVVNDGNKYTASIANAVAGEHTLKAVVKDILGKTTECTRTVTSSKIVLKNSIVSPYVFANTEYGNAQQSDSKTNDKWVISSSSPKRELYYGYDISALTEMGYDIDKAWVIGKSETSGGNISLYDLKDELRHGAVYNTVPNCEEIEFASMDMSDLSVLRPKDFIHPENNYDFGIDLTEYNFSCDITEYVKEKAETCGGKFGFKAAAAQSSKTYLLPEHMMICLRFSGQNIRPEVTLNGPTESQFLAGETIRFSVNATDSDGTIAEVKFFVDGAEQPCSASGDEYYTEVSGLEVRKNPYEFKVTVTDNGGKSVVIKKDIFVVNQIINRVSASVSASEYAQILHPKGSLQSYQSPENKWLWGNAGIFYQYCAMKFDMSGIGGYDIEKVEILTPGDTSTKYNVTASVYKLTDNNWDKKSDYYTLPPYDKNVFSSTNASSDVIQKLSKNGYTGISDDYMLAFDVTDSVKENINCGEMQQSYIITIDSGIYCIGNAVPLMYVTYKDNKRPVISLVAPESSAVVPNEDLTVSADITDADSQIASVECLFDGKSVDLSVSGNCYTANLSGDKITEGEHEITFSAVDSEGASSVYTRKIYATGYRIDSKAFTDGNGGKAQLAAGSSIEFEVKISSASDKLNLTAIIALYNENNTMRALNCADKVFAKGEADSIKVAITVPSDVDSERSSVKAFIIDDFTDMSIIDGITEFK